MNIASLFNLAGPDLFVILIIVLLLFGAKKLWTKDEFDEFFGKQRDRLERPQENRGTAVLNRFLVPIAIVIFLLALEVWVSGR